MIHPAISSRFHHLEGITSFAEAFGDPEQAARLGAFMFDPSWPQPPASATRETVAPGPHGPVRLRIYEPAAGGSTRPCLVWMHGGAFQAGDLNMPEADWTAREIAARAGAVVVSVDYRLAVGGVTYPVPLDDVVSALRWVRDAAAELDIDPGRISVGGASAGGNLAAGAVLRVRDEDGWLPASLAAVYPAMHAVVPVPDAALAAKLAEVPPVLRFLPGDIDGINANYLGGANSRSDGYAMPGQGDLSRLCPTLVVNAEYDDLRPSGQAFAASLALGGVDVRQLTAPGTLHGFLNLSASIEPVGDTLDLLASLVTGTNLTRPTLQETS
jgi:acetyl esterase/lipase